MPRGSNQFPRDLPDLLGQLDLEVLEQWNQLLRLLEDLLGLEPWNLLLPDLLDLEVLEQWNQLLRLLEDLLGLEPWNLLLPDLLGLELSKLDLLDLPAPVPLVHLAVLWDPGHPEGLLDLGQLSLLQQHPLAPECHRVPVDL